ncbi:MAG: acetylxylan esterase [Deltaproteobacteria bacterium]|nr:acetylxylan esterase [Deltaproteobacteria bacterium]
MRTALRSILVVLFLAASAVACSGSGAGTQPGSGPLDTSNLAFDSGIDTASASDQGAAADADAAAADATEVSGADAPLDPDTTADSAPDVEQLDDAEDSAAAADVASPDAAADASAETAQPADAAVVPDGPVWDLPKVSDASTAQCTYTNPKNELKDLTMLATWHVTYQSWESIDGKLVPITIKGFAARPANATSKLPGVILAHGLGGYATLESAESLAARLGMFVIAYSGPGSGTNAADTSGGQGPSVKEGYRMFDTLADPRGSWFWGHATAAMRGVTCLANHPDVKSDSLGITGFSAGGVMSWLVAAHDPRIKVAVPMSGSLAWDVATESPTAWQHTLLQKAGLSIASPEWKKLMSELISPSLGLPNSAVKVLMLNGTTDEFFPLTATQATFSQLPGADHRYSLIGNFDHGCFGLTGGESKAEIEARASLRADGGQRMWFRHWFGTDSNYAYVPQPPQVSVQSAGGMSLVTAIVDSGGSKLAVDEVRAWASGDNCYFFASATLDAGKNGIWSKIVPLAFPPNAVYFVDVQYKTKTIIPEKFSISSAPVIPAGLVPKIRAIDSCQ